ncbi:hypothetical protein AGIG_G9141 [Arapaima gigas]
MGDSGSLDALLPCRSHDVSAVRRNGPEDVEDFPWFSMNNSLCILSVSQQFCRSRSSALLCTFHWKSSVCHSDLEPRAVGRRSRIPVKPSVVTVCFWTPRLSSCRNQLTSHPARKMTFCLRGKQVTASQTKVVLVNQTIP